MLHNEELHSLYHSPNIVRVIKSRRLRWAGHGVSFAFKILAGKSTVKRHRWEGNISTDLKGIGVNTRNLIDLAQDEDY